MADLSDTSRWWFNCVWVSLCVRRYVAILLGAWWMADYETLHVCQQCVKFWWWPSDPIKILKRFKNVICHFVFQNMRSAGYHEKMIGRTYFGDDQVTQFNLVLYNTIKSPYQPKHSPSYYYYYIITDKDREETASPELGALSDFHQLLLLRLLRPDRLPTAMTNYVNRHLSLTTDDTGKLTLEQILDVTRDSHTGVLVLSPPVMADSDVSNVCDSSGDVSPVSIICDIAEVCIFRNCFLQVNHCDMFMWIYKLEVTFQSLYRFWGQAFVNFTVTLWIPLHSTMAFICLLGMQRKLFL